MNIIAQIRVNFQPRHICVGSQMAVRVKINSRQVQIAERNRFITGCNNNRWKSFWRKVDGRRRWMHHWWGWSMDNRRGVNHGLNWHRNWNWWTLDDRLGNWNWRNWNWNWDSRLENFVVKKRKFHGWMFYTEVGN